MKKCVIITARDPIKYYGGDINRLNTLIQQYSKHFKVTVIITGYYKKALLEDVMLGSVKVQVIYVSNSLLRKCAGIIWALFRDKPLQVGIFANPYVQRQVSTMLKAKAYDLCIFHLFRTFIPSSTLLTPKVHLDLCDVQSKAYGKQKKVSGTRIFRRWLYRYEYIRTKRIEKNLANAEDVSISLISQEDTNHYLKSYNVKNKIWSLPNNFNLTHMDDMTKKRNKVAIVGNFYAAHNQLLVDQAIKHKIARDPNLQLFVIGQMTQTYEGKINKSGVKAVRNPLNIVDHLSDSEYGLCFLEYSAGFQTKLIDYANAGLVPIVSENVARGAELIDLNSCLVIKKLNELPKCFELNASDKQGIVRNFRLSLNELKIYGEKSWSKHIMEI